MRWFNWGKKPAAPKLRTGKQRGIGSRGIAIRSTKNPDLSPENVSKWQTLTGEQVDNFVYNQEPLLTHSSNVAMMQYFIDTNKLMVEFNNGSAYLYSNISETEAFEFAQASSKGSAIWDRLRVRGSARGHKKPYTRLK